MGAKRKSYLAYSAYRSHATADRSRAYQAPSTKSPASLGAEGRRPETDWRLGPARVGCSLPAQTWLTVKTTLDCYWPGSLDFNFLGGKCFFSPLYPEKVELFAGGQQQPRHVEASFNDEGTV